jgi:hypothetical protein
MKNYYPGMHRASDEEKQKLIEEIDPAQTGNESHFCGELAKFPVSLNKVNANADLIGRAFSFAKPVKA